MMHSVRLCLLVTRLDAAAPGGASSNRRWGVDTGAPGAPATTAPGHLGIQSGPRPRSSVKRERAWRPREGAQDQGWFSPWAWRVHTHQTAILEDCGAHRVFTTASFSHYLLLPILQLPRFPSSLHHHSPSAFSNVWTELGF